MIHRWLCRDARGSTTVEFAVVGWMLCMVTFGVFETGLVWWLKSGMQITAAMTARCGAVGYTTGAQANPSNFTCTSTSTTQNFAVNTFAPAWLFPNMITTNNVTVGGQVASCNGVTGNFFSVSITSGFFSFLPPPLGNYTSLSASACYPMNPNG
jgi:Flp pilus assembly protein TadG